MSKNEKNFNCYSIVGGKELSIKKLYSILQLDFKNTNLFIESITHKSSRIKNEAIKTYERLEFLGDAILKFCISEYVFKNFSSMSEGEMSKIVSSLVSRELCRKVAYEIGLNEVIIVKNEETLVNGEKSIVADIMESCIGAIYLEFGIDNVKSFILKHWRPHIDIIKNDGDQNFKAILQEICQKKRNIIPQYNLINRSGPDHSSVFCVECEIEGMLLPLFKGFGKTKKDAEKSAAKSALEYISSLK